MSDVTDEEIAAASEMVCAKPPSLTPDDINAALRAGIEEEQRNVAAAGRVLEILKAMPREKKGGPLPGLHSSFLTAAIYR